MDSQFWNHILTTATAIENISELESENLALLLEHLESIDVLYYRNFDPADTYQEYVAVALCHAVGKVLSKTLSK